jgi:hypothetical protein
MSSAVNEALTLSLSPGGEGRVRGKYGRYYTPFSLKEKH